MVNLTFQWEPINHLLNTGINELGMKSWEETWTEDGFKYDPDWARYKRMEEENILRFLAVRKEGNLVGYASVILTSSFHDRDTCCAIVQDFYLDVDSRKGSSGIKLFWVLEEQLKALGVNYIFVAEKLHIKADKGGLGKMLEYLNFNCHEKVWTKHIEGTA